jgi:DNA-directed RNA polymerase omega subunit
VNVTNEENSRDPERREGPPAAASSFAIRMPDVDNIYELVVVAAQRARQLNLANRILPPESGFNPVEKALGEALAQTVKFEVSDKPRKEPT